MTTNLSRPTMSTNHDGGRTVAPGPFPAIRREISEIAAKTLRAAPSLCQADRQFLKDIQREERYQGRWIARLVELAAKCPSDTDAFALADRFRALIGSRRHRARLGLAEAVERETEAQACADLAEVRAVLAQGNVGVLVRCERALLDHRFAIDELLESVQSRRLELVGATA